MIYDHFMTTCIRLHNINEEKARHDWGHERVKSMRTTCSATYWEHGELAIYHSLSRGAPEVAREPSVQLWALMSGAVWAIRLYFARHPTTSPVLFHEKTTNATENCGRITDLVRTTIRSRRFDVGGV